MTQQSYFLSHPEANPLGWSHLDSAQRGAFRRILEHLKSALDEQGRVDNEGDGEGSASILEEHRTNRLIFVTGERGTGKTTLWLSLLKAISGPHAWKSSATRSGATSTDEDYKEVCGLLDDLSSQVVLLHQLDMEILPGPSNLLAAILERVEIAVGDRMRRVDRSRGLLDPMPDEALRKLQHLKTDVARAWEGNLQQRSAGLDPDAYAQEVMRAEKARVLLRYDVRDLLDKIAKTMDIPGRERARKLFLLPVDDFDMNPSRCLELLRLLRMISGRRLFILILGEIETVETILNLKMTGELAALTNQTDTSLLAIPPQVVAASARWTSAYGMRKLIPPSQRIELGRMKIDEARKYPQHNSEAQPLEKLLDRLPLRIMNLPENKEINLFEMMFGYPLNRDKEHEEQRKKKQEEGTRWGYPYSGSAFFHAPPRYICDVYQRLLNAAAVAERSSRDRNTVNPEIDVFANCFRESVDEEKNLTPHEKQAFRDAVRKDFNGQWEFHTEAVRPVHAASPAFLLTPVQSACSLLVSKAKDWDFESSMPRSTHHGDKDTDPSHVWKSLTDQTTATIILLHDLLALQSSSGIVGELLVPEGHQLPWMVAKWNAGPENNVVVPWPTAAWSSFWELNQLRENWNHTVEGMHNRETMSAVDKVVVLAFAWIEGTTRSLDRNLKLGGYHIEKDKWETPWTLLVRRVESLLLGVKTVRGTRSRWKDLVEQWLGSLACLLCPEAGLPNVVVKPFADAPMLVEYWSKPEVIRYVRRLRMIHLERFYHHKEEFLGHCLFAPWRAVAQVRDVLEKKLTNELSKRPVLANHAAYIISTFTDNFAELESRHAATVTKMQEISDELALFRQDEVTQQLSEQALHLDTLISVLLRPLLLKEPPPPSGVNAPVPAVRSKAGLFALTDKELTHVREALSQRKEPDAWKVPGLASRTLLLSSSR